MSFADTYIHLGDLSACEPWAARWMCCDKCHVSWIGCWDNFQCPRCGEGELPSHEQPFVCLDPPLRALPIVEDRTPEQLAADGDGYPAEAEEGGSVDG